MRILRQNQNKNGEKRERPWVVIACGRLILLQGAGLLFLAWMELPDRLGPQLEIAEVWLGAALALLGLYALLTSLRFLRMRPNARSQAMLVQGAGLLAALWLYWGARPSYVYFVMAFNVFMVLYLQHPDVRATFPLLVGEAEEESLP